MPKRTDNPALPDVVEKSVVPDHIAKSLIDGGMKAVMIEIEIIRDGSGKEQFRVRPRRIL